MTDYSKMSDHDLNRLVALKIGGIALALAVSPFGKSESGSWHDFDPCNSWADAGPIIVDNLISLRSRIEGGWSACNEWGLSFTAVHMNPLRAAMIVFLMMKGQGDG